MRPYSDDRDIRRVKTHLSALWNPIMIFSNAIRRIFGTLLGSGLLTAMATAGIAAERSNIVFVLADDLGYREVGSFGQKKIQTSHLDQLAAEGMRLTQHYSGNAVCAPSRCVLLTGRHPGHATIHGPDNNYGSNWRRESAVAVDDRFTREPAVSIPRVSWVRRPAVDSNGRVESRAAANGQRDITYGTLSHGD